MLYQLLNKERILIHESVDSWESAITSVCKPLIGDDSISEEYCQAIIQTTKELGPYYVLAPGIAMPHERPERGALRNALSLLIVKNGVPFHSEENDPVYLILLLSACDKTQHIELMTGISNFVKNRVENAETFVSPGFFRVCLKHVTGIKVFA